VKKVPSPQPLVLGGSAAKILAWFRTIKRSASWDWGLGTGGLLHGTLLLLAVASPATAQSPTADSLWALRDYAAARVEYTKALHENPGYVRSLFRLAILAAWDGQLDSSLALLQDAREIEPMEPDVRLWQAKVLTWQGRYKPALALYDSLVNENRRSRDARLGQAQALAWSGQNDEADRGYRWLLDANPEDTEALYGLAQLRLWQGRPGDADRYISTALQVAPLDRPARELQNQIRALRRPRLEFSLGLSHDSDKNTAWWQTLGTSAAIGQGLRGFGSVGAYEASDPAQKGTRLSAEMGATWNGGNASLTAAIGARKLSSEFGLDRSLGTWRASASYRAAPTAGVGIGYTHYSFDETAELLGNDIDIDELSADADIELRPNLTLGAGAGLGLISDNNRRKSLALALMERLVPRLSLGLFGRGVWYDFHGAGYFSPDQFLLGEARGAYTQALGRWEGKLSTGVGAQQSGGGAGVDGEWHFDLRFARRWGTINEVALSAAISNNALSSTSGAFHYYTSVLSVRLGL
jgi:tetratricopeptide (TPR) repeat protein